VRMLVVEDDPLIWEFVLEALRNRGYDVVPRKQRRGGMTWCKRRVPGVLVTVRFSGGNIRLPNRPRRNPLRRRREPGDQSCPRAVFRLAHFRRGTACPNAPPDKPRGNAIERKAEPFCPCLRRVGGPSPLPYQRTRSRQFPRRRCRTLIMSGVVPASARRSRQNKPGL
jgi:hypothetical protein